MPFDAISSPPSLTFIVRCLGIAPIPRVDFETYKDFQLREHPGNPWYHYRFLAEAIISIFFLACGLGVIAGCVTAVIWLGTYAGMICMLFAFGSATMLAFLIMSGVLIGTLTLTGPATWSESDVVWSEVPIEIAAVARHVLHHIPDARPMVGKLVQDTRVLDPYLIIRRGDEEVCLGIWDDHGVLYRSEMPKIDDAG